MVVRSLVEAAGAYFRDHFMDAVKNDEFLHLSAEDLAHLIDSDDVNVRLEEDVYRAGPVLAATRHRKQKTVSAQLVETRPPSTP